jgi:hypothetical protein
MTSGDIESWDLFGADDESWMIRLADQLDPLPSPYIGRPVAWVNERLGEYTTRDQVAIMDSVAANRYTAVPSCNDVGKSYSGSRLVSWWIDSFPPGEAFVVTTAPTAAQVSAILWREIGKAHRKGKLIGTVNGANEWKIMHGTGKTAQSELIAYGRKPADYDPSGFLGIHARYVLVIIDEACGVPQALYQAVDSLVTNQNGRVLAIGNPDDPSSHFQKICQPDSIWNVIRIDALTSAGMTKERLEGYPDLVRYMISQGIPPTDERIPEELYDMLVSPLWVEERMKEWGIDSPIFASRVRGAFPNVTIDTLIHPHWVTLAQLRELEPRPMMTRFGVDVARYGTDHTIIMARQGGHCRVIEDIPYGPVTEVAGKVIHHGLRMGSDSLLTAPVACIDDTGVGGGVTDILAEEGYPHVAIVAGEASSQVLPTGKARFVNRRSELLWNLREALAGPSGTGEDGWLDLDPNDTTLQAQLTNIKYSINRYGQIQVESKADIKKRRGNTGSSSPDEADALSYSIAPDKPRFAHRPDLAKSITSDILTMEW